MTLRIRSREITLLDAAIERALNERHAAIVVTGEPATGKSIAARTASDLAVERGHRAVWAVGRAPLVEELRAGLAGELGRDLPRESNTATHAQEVRLHLFELEQRHHATLVFVDQLERASDADTIFLLDLVSQPRRNIVFVLIVSQAAGHPLPPGLTRFLVEAGSRSDMPVITIEPLQLADITEIIEEHNVEEPWVERFATDLLALSRGNLTRAIALLRGVLDLPPEKRRTYLSGTRHPDTFPLPPLIRDLIVNVDSLAPEARLVAEALAVWNAPASVPVLAEMLDSDTPGVEEALDQLEGDRVVRAEIHGGAPEFAFMDSLAGVVLRRAAPTIRGRKLHDRAAAILRGRASLDRHDAVRLAAHILHGSGPLLPDDAERVVRGARLLVARSRYATAGDMLLQLLERLRLEQGPDPAVRDAMVLLAETQSRAGSWERANRTLALTAAESDSPSTSAAALLRVARDHVALGQEHEALAVYEQILAIEGLDQGTRVRVTVDAARVENFLGQPHASLRHYSEAVRVADATRDISHRAEARIAAAQGLGGFGQVRTGLRVGLEGFLYARRARNPSLIASAEYTVGSILNNMAEPLRGLRWLEWSLRESEAIEDYPTIAWLHSTMGTIHFELGNWLQAERYLQSAVRMDAGMNRMRTLRNSRAALRRLRTHRPTVSADGDLDGDLETTVGGSDLAILELVAEFEQAFVAGELDLAGAIIERALEVGRTPGWENRLVGMVLPKRAQLCSVLGSAAGLQAVVDEFEQLAEDHPEHTGLLELEVLHARALLAGARGECGRAVELGTEASRAFRDHGYRWREAQALLETARFAHRSGDLEVAETRADEAYAHFAAMGATPWVSATREVLRELGRRPRRGLGEPKPLTPRQWEIAVLASRGYTDAEIATTLSISRRTVTTHMHNILKQLHVTSRGALRDWFYEHGQRAAVSDSGFVAKG